MQVHIGVELLRPEWTQCIACIGTFDGVHRGHRVVIETAVRWARERSLPCVLVTFDRHPAAILNPAVCPKPITSVAANLDEFGRLGVSVALVLPFDAALSQMTAQEFLDRILIQTLRAEALVVGHDFAMGQGREGTTDWLQARMETEVIAPMTVDGLRVSSSAIRDAVVVGDVPLAHQLLGRAFDIPGIVARGDQIGRTLGFPTANLARSFDQVRPADGIYAGRFTCSLGVWGAAAYVGNRPTVNGIRPTIEAFLLDYPGDSLYGLEAHLELIERIRPDQRFDSLDALKAQMARDVERVRERLRQENTLISAN